MLKPEPVRVVTAIICVCFLVYTVYAGQGADPVVCAPTLQKTLLLDTTSKGDSRLTAGDHGLIYFSRGNGNCNKTELPEGVTLTAVFLHDDNLAWVAGHDAVIYRTDNGGATWEKVYSAPEKEAPLLDLWFNDDKYGIAVGAYGLYLTTTDGGKSWSPGKMNIIETDNSRIDRNSINDLAESYDLHLNAIAQSESGKLYMVAEAGRIYRSDDLGNTWQELPSPYSGSLFGVLPLEDDRLLVFGLRGHMYRTEDSGNSWAEIRTDTREMLTNGIRLSDGTVVITGMGGTILHSSDRGRTFSIKELGHRHSYSAVIEGRDNKLILVGDHGLQSYTRLELGIEDD